ncbi:collagen alpha-1(I) chain [Macaca nemestrina]|uniref:collagen alpha-1(I) chain n=1 Tax=Macaca nemestrina TaxID=9545 RepID=UPI0039B87DC6
MSRATGRGALPRLRRGEQAAKMPGRCVGPSRSGRGVRRPWGKRRGAGTSRGRGARRRARSLEWETRCVSAERAQGRQRPWGTRQAAETADAAGANEALEAPGPPGSIEAARDPGAVWVNGAVGEPEVVGPAGAVWVTGSGEEEAEDRSPRGCEGKGRPGSLGHESILHLWLKVQAMRAASGCGEGSRVELHPVPVGEGPVERGVPGRASWVETSRGGLTGPWVKGQARGIPRAPSGPTVLGLGAAYERTLGFCGQGQAGRVPPPVSVPGALASGSEMAPHLWRGQAVGIPGTGEEIGYGLVPGPCEKEQAVGEPGTVGWPGAVGAPRAVEGELGCGGAAGLWGRGHSPQIPGALAHEAVCGATPGVWGRGQAVGVFDAVEEEPTSVGAAGVCYRRQAGEETDSVGMPGPWGTGHSVGVPCATEEETRCGGDPGFRERGQPVWVETGSGGDPGSRGAAQTAEPSCPGEQAAGSGGAPGLWGIEQATGVPRALGKDTGCVNVPGLWGAGQVVGVPQAVVVPGALGEELSHSGALGLWDGQQVLAGPPAEAVPGLGEETCGGNVLSLWERRQAVGEPESLGPPALGVPGSVDQEAGCGVVSCLCRRRQAVGVSETVGIPRAADVAQHRCATAGVPVALGVPGSGKAPVGVPAAVWASGPVCQEGNSRDIWNLWERARAARISLASGGPVAREELWSSGEDCDSGAFSGPWGRRQTIGVSVAPEGPGLGEETDSGGIPRPWGWRQRVRTPVATEVLLAPRAPGSVELEPGSGGFSGLSGRQQTAGMPGTVGLSAASGVPVAPRVPRPVQEETGSELWGKGETVGGPADAKGPTRMEVPTSTRMPGPMGEKTGSGGVSGLLGGRQTTGVSMAVRLPGSVGEGALFERVSGLSGRRQTAGRPVAARGSMAVGVPTAPGLPGPMLGDTGSGDDCSGIWARTLATEGPTAARVPGPVEGETGSEGVSGLWRRRHSGAIPEAGRVPMPLGVLAAVGAPMAGRTPAAVWVTGSSGAEVDVGVSGVTMLRRQSTGGVGASEDETGGGNILGLAGSSQAVGASHTYVPGTRLWSCPRSVGEETAFENALDMSGTRTAVGVPPVSREEIGLGHFRDHLQPSGRRLAGEVSAVRVRGSNLGESYVGEARLRGAFQ